MKLLATARTFAISSMSSSFPKNGLFESNQFTRRGLSAQFDDHDSVHRRAGGVGAFPGPAVSLCAQLVEKVHDRLFRRVIEGPARDVLGVDQQFFGFRHFATPLYRCRQFARPRVQPHAALFAEG